MTSTERGTACVSIVEVAPRDGLQNYDRPISTADKIAFVNALSRTGLRTIEVTSFVNPAAVPLMADAAGVMRGIDRVDGVRYLVLVPNVRGYERASEAGVDAIALFASATEEFSQANLNASIDGALDRFAAVAERATADDAWIRGYVSVAFHCPYSGPVSPVQVIPIVECLLKFGCDEIALADTDGMATPEQVTTLVRECAGVVAQERLALHFHDTRGLAIDNIAAGYAEGVRTFDGSAGGIGGCPFSPGAPGNVATERVLEYFELAGIATGVETQGVIAAYRHHVLGQEA